MKATTNRKGATRAGAYRVLLMVSCILLAGLLLFGGYFAAGAYFRRQARIDFYSSDAAGYNKEMYLDKEYHLFLYDADRVYLLHHAADKGALYFEVAAEWLRNQGYEEQLHSEKLLMLPLWIPRGLQRSDYRDTVLPLLEALHVPVLDEDTTWEYQHGLLSLRKTNEEAGSYSSLEEKISLSVHEMDNQTGATISTTTFYYTHNPMRWQEIYADEAEYHQVSAVRELQTADGHTVTYYTPQRLEDKLEPGSAWGEVYIIEDTPMYLSPTWYNTTANGTHNALHSLTDSTLLSYADYLENDEALRAEMEGEWRTISRIYYGIVLYAVLFVVCVAALVIAAWGLLRARRGDRRRRALGVILVVSLLLLCLATGVLAAYQQAWERKVDDAHAIYRAGHSSGLEDRTYVTSVPLQALALMQRAAQKDGIFFRLAAQRAREMMPTDADSYVYDTSYRWVAYDMDRGTYLREVLPYLEQTYLPVLGMDAAYQYAPAAIRIYKPDGDTSRFARRIDIGYGIVNKATGFTEETWRSVELPLEEDYWSDFYDGQSIRYEKADSIRTDNGYEIAYYVQQGSKTYLWGEIASDGKTLVYLTPSTEGPHESLQECTVMRLTDYLAEDTALNAAIEDEWARLQAQHAGYIAFIVWFVLDVAAAVGCAVMLIVWRKGRRRQRATGI